MEVRYLFIFAGIVALYFLLPKIGRRFVVRMKMAFEDCDIPSADVLKYKIETIAGKLKELVQPLSRETVYVEWYGAYDIDPKHLVFWICVETDAAKRLLEADGILATRMRGLLDEYEYPKAARREVYIGFESQETVDRESGGNWWYHWK